MKKFWKMGAIVLAAMMCVASFAACDEENNAIGGDVTSDVTGDLIGGGTGGGNDDGIIYGEVTAEEWVAAFEAIYDLRDFKQGGSISLECQYEELMREGEEETIEEKDVGTMEWLNNGNCILVKENADIFYLYGDGRVDDDTFLQELFFFKLEPNGEESDLIAYYLETHPESEDIWLATDMYSDDSEMYFSNLTFGMHFWEDEPYKKWSDLVYSSKDYITTAVLEHPEWYERAQYAENAYILTLSEKDDPKYDESNDNYENYSISCTYTMKFTEGKLSYWTVDWIEIEDDEEETHIRTMKFIYKFDYNVPQIIRPEWADEAILEVRKELGLA